METENTAPSGRPRSWLLIVLAALVAVFVFTRMWSDGQAVAPQRPAAPAKGNKAEQPIDPKELDVRLEDLEAPRPAQGDMERNPFRFQPKAPPAPPPGAVRPMPAEPAEPVPPPPPAGPPPIPLKLMGFITLPDGSKVASLSDCKGGTFRGAENEVVDGQYRVTKIGIESIQIEYVNGTGRQTMRVEGCPPR
jgi:hypothetical protein